MTKKKFLSELEKKLSVLNESEIKDIVNEYSDIIDEKVKHGKTEKEAIEDFGKLDDLAKEILSAYKINPDYKETRKDEFEASAKKLGEDFDEFIKKGAAKASQVTKDVIDNVKENEQEFTVEFIFELLFKAIAALLLCLVASIPVSIIKELGRSLLEIFMFPVSGMLIFCWEIILGILFLVFCGFIFVAMFRPYVRPTKQNKKTNVKKNDSVESEKESKKKDNVEETRVEAKPRPVRVERNWASTLVIVMMQIAVLLFVLLPLWFLELGIGMGFAVLIFGLFKGIYFWGPILLCIGGLSLFGGISSVIYRVVFTEKKPHFYGMIASIIFIIVGLFLTIDLVVRFRYIDSVPNSFETEKYVEQVTITKPVVFQEYYNINQVSKKTDNTMENGILKFEIIYYHDVSDNLKLNQIEKGTNLYLQLDRIYHDNEFGSPIARKVYDSVIQDLQKNELHNYTRLDDYQVVIYGNQQTLDLLTIQSYYYSSYNYNR